MATKSEHRGHGVSLDSAAPDFSSRAKELILSKTAFQFVMRGESAVELRPFIVDGALVDAYKLGVNRRLRDIQVVSFLAGGAGRPVRFAILGDEITGTVLGLAGD